VEGGGGLDEFRFRLPRVPQGDVILSLGPSWFPELRAAVPGPLGGSELRV